MLRLRASAESKIITVSLIRCLIVNDFRMVINLINNRVIRPVIYDGSVMWVSGCDGTQPAALWSTLNYH